MCKKSCFLNSNIVGNRKIIIWGAGVRGKEMIGLLSRYGYGIEGFVDSYLGGKEETVCGLPVYGEGYLEGKQNSLFVLVSMDRYYDDVKERLYDLNYTEIMDFCWLNRTPIEPEIKNGAYQDDFGNVLNIRCEASKLRVTFMGKNNHLDIDESVCIKNNMTIYLSDGSDVSIKNSSVYGLNNINVVGRSKLVIREKSIIKACTMNIRQNSFLTITNMLLENGSNLEVLDKSNCIMAYGVMEGICKVTTRSLLSMEQIYSKAKKITVYRKGRLQIRKTKLSKKVDISTGDAAEASIFTSEIGKAARLTVRKHSDLRMENVLLEKAVLSLFDAGKASFFECRLGQASDIIVWKHSVLCLKQIRLQEAEIKSTNHAEIIAEESTFKPKARISANQDTKINLRSMEVREGANILGSFSSEIDIGRNCKATKNLYILVDHGSRLTVGEDCVFAQDTTILSGDSHPVFQIEHPKRYEAGSRVEISNHVWLGKSSIVLSNAVVGEGCIVAPNSVVGKKYPNNCLLMGYPAKIIRQNIAYDLKECNPDEITDRRYWKHTDLEK